MVPRYVYSSMGQSRIYTMPYSHLAAYVAIALPKGHVMGPTSIALWYQHISVMP